MYPPSGGGSTIYPGGTPGGNGTIVNPDNNQGNQQPTVDSKDKQGNNKTKKIKKSDTMEKVPKTGDNTGQFGLFFCFSASAHCLAQLLSIKSEREYKIENLT